MARSLEREIDPALLAEISSGYFWGVGFVFLDFSPRPVRANTSSMLLRWDDQDWLPTGQLGEMTLTPRSSPNAQGRATLTLNAIPEDYLELYDGEAQHDARAQLWFGAIDDDGNLIGEPTAVFNGLVDSESGAITSGRDGRAFSISIGIRDGAAPRTMASSTHSAANQSAKHPGDTAAQHLVGITSNRWRWPV